ncbi:Pathogenesis-related protein 1A [Colletotrichum trifolii]|uniref:Pathogenesis-related protein 1A n=1 Tax=Colletotrichum trifolii TaxID=5466 RepID=A0A4V3HSK3_COLTR|nr:Pathogenesis-related protein 1A [Colletotrichum trifolii]
MRFSAVVVAAMATNAAAWRGQGRPSGSYWGWGGYGGGYGGDYAVTSTITVPAAAATTPAVVPIPEPVAEAVKTTSAAPAATSAPSSSGSGSSGLDADQQKALDAHNAARAEVGVPDLVWDDSLASNAQEWATHLLSVGSLTHSQTSGEGENLYMQSGGDAPNANAATAWLDEKSLYKGETISESNYMGFGHYTQAVWKSTTKVGMAIATDSKGATYVVARYSPPGNYIGEKPY